MACSCRLLALGILFVTAGISLGFQFRPRPIARAHRGRATTPHGLRSNPNSDGGGDGVGGPVLEPAAAATDPERFDAACVANPVVLPPSSSSSAEEGNDEKWQMYYYGNPAGSWNRGVPAFLPTGWCGLAESDDGVRWTKVDGSCANGAILGPSDDPDAWDSVQVGVGDVVRVPVSGNDDDDGRGGGEGEGGELHMYYFGGSSEPVGLGEMAGGMELAGFRMRIGRAKSSDGGRTWERMGMCLDYDDAEGIFASWPRIILPSKEGRPYRMTYHVYNGKKWRVFGAESFDRGDTWTRTGLVLDGNHDDENSFDFSGIGTRAIAPWREGLLMVYEGVGKGGKHCLGAAFCDDPDGDSTWGKIRIEGSSEQPGGPILEPGVGAMGPWTKTVVGTPYLVAMPDGSLRLYFVAKSGDAGHSIGLLYSETGEVTPESWQPLS